MGYGESSIKFELRVWPTQFHQWGQVRSDLAVAVFDAVKAADGMSFPFPQREVRLLRDPAPDSAAAAKLPAHSDGDDSA
jgi:small-conductance mechanosensitive channel